MPRSYYVQLAEEKSKQLGFKVYSAGYYKVELLNSVKWESSFDRESVFNNTDEILADLKQGGLAVVDTDFDGKQFRVLFRMDGSFGSIVEMNDNPKDALEQSYKRKDAQKIF